MKRYCIRRNYDSTGLNYYLGRWSNQKQKWVFVRTSEVKGEIITKTNTENHVEIHVRIKNGANLT